MNPSAHPCCYWDLSRCYELYAHRLSLHGGAQDRHARHACPAGAGVRRPACVASYFFTNFSTFVSATCPPYTLPSSSTPTPSGAPVSNGMKAITLPSLILPMRMPCLKPGLVAEVDCESAT